LFSAATLTNNADGVIDLQGDSANLTSFNGTNSLLNSGIVKHSSGTGTTTISVTLTNQTTGEILVATGTLSITTLTNLSSGTLTAQTYRQSAGTTTVAGGATLQAGSTGTGAITINGGTLTGNGTVTGALSGTGTVSPGRAAGPLAVTGTYGPGTSGTLAIGI